jgi:hypothetical protein
MRGTLVIRGVGGVAATFFVVIVIIVLNSVARYAWQASTAFRTDREAGDFFVYVRRAESLGFVRSQAGTQQAAWASRARIFLENTVRPRD